MRLRPVLPHALILIAVVLAYLPALCCGFVWDDTALVLRDPLIRSPLLLFEGLRHFLFIDATPSNFFRPLQRMVYTADYAAAGFSPFVFHLTSVLVHAGAALAFFEFGRRLLQRLSPPPPTASAAPFPSAPTFAAFAAALVWSVHPLHSSAVAYISGLADPLAALCGFGGLALILGNRRVAAGFALGAALFAKESGATLLLIGLGFAWLTTAGAAQANARAHLRTRMQLFLRVALPALLMVALYAGLRSSAERIAPPSSAPVPAAVRPILALRAVATYGQLLVAPVRLTMERDVTTRTGGAVEPTLAAARSRELQTLAGALLLAAAALWFRAAGPGFSVPRQCLAAALLAYLPISNLFELNATVAEHWIYVPSALLLLAAMATLITKVDLRPAEGSVRGSSALRWAMALLAIITLALALRTAIRCRDWRTQETFLEATIRSSDQSDRMFTNRAALKLGRGDIAGATADYRAALALKPEQPLAMLGLAQALSRQRKWSEARQWLNRCDRIPFLQADALVARAALEYAEAGRDRVELLERAARVNPHFWPVRKRYILHLMERGDDGKALKELRAVLSEQSFCAETWQILGGLLTRRGEHAAASTAFAEAARLDLHHTFPVLRF